MSRRIVRRAAVGILLVAILAACAPAAAPTPAPTPKPQAPAKAATPTAAVPTAATPTAAAPKPTAAPPTPTPRPATLRFGHDRTTSRAGAYIAIEKGFFKEQGIDIEPVNFRATGEMIGPISTGQLDFAGTPVNSALLAAADRGLELRVVASASQEARGQESFWAALRKDLADSGRVKTPADLKGMKIAIASVGGISRMLVEMILEEGGLKPNDVELVTLPFADQIPAFANKAIDVGIASDPYLSEGVRQGVSVKWIPNHKYFDGRVEGAFIVFSPQLVKKSLFHN